MEISVARAVFQVPIIRINIHTPKVFFCREIFTTHSPFSELSMGHGTSNPSVSVRWVGTRGLQKRLFGVPKLEDANMAGTKEATVIGRYLDVPLEVRINGWQTGYFTYLSRWRQLKYFFMFIPNLGEIIHFDSYFSDGSKPPIRL